jgi:hypothetical protein
MRKRLRERVSERETESYTECDRGEMQRGKWSLMKRRKWG